MIKHLNVHVGLFRIVIMFPSKKDVQFGRTISSAIARHTEQLEHEMDWANTECLEKEKD